MQERPSFEQLEAVRRLGTCAVSDAIATFQVRLKNEGFAGQAVRCMTESLPPVMGYAVTGRIRCSSLPQKSQSYIDRLDWLQYLLTIPAPRMVVLQDIDNTAPGLGAFWDSAHAHLHRALGCVGAVTNGSVRQTAEAAALGFALFAGGVSPSRGYVHIVDFGQVVEIAGLTIAPGDLVHGDRYGVQTVPQELVAGLPAAAGNLEQKRDRLRALCRDPERKLDAIIEAARQLP